MERLIYLYAGSFAGLLHAVARAVKEGKEVQTIATSELYTPSLFDQVIYLTADSEQAERLLQYLHRLHPQAARLALYGYLSEDKAATRYHSSGTSKGCTQRIGTGAPAGSKAALKGVACQPSG